MDAPKWKRKEQKETERTEEKLFSVFSVFSCSFLFYPARLYDYSHSPSSCHLRPSRASSRLAASVPQEPAGYSIKPSFPCFSQDFKIGSTMAQPNSDISARANNLGAPITQA